MNEINLFLFPTLSLETVPTGVGLKGCIVNMLVYYITERIPIKHISKK